MGSLNQPRDWHGRWISGSGAPIRHLAGSMTGNANTTARLGGGGLRTVGINRKTIHTARAVASRRGRVGAPIGGVNRYRYVSRLEAGGLRSGNTLKIERGAARSAQIASGHRAPSKGYVVVYRSPRGR